MSSPIQLIPFLQLALVLIPVLIVLAVLFTWSAGWVTGAYATARMLGQLLLVGYMLTYIFQSHNSGIVASVLAVMLLAAGWISLHPLKRSRRALYPRALLSISAGGVLTLLLVTQGVLGLELWFEARFVIPLGGMIFAAAMNAVSLAAERFEAEGARGLSYQNARQTAFRAALIPITNSLLAVGIVSFPGMMTGQILSGVDPFVAARYQIMVMSMIFSSAGLSAACYLYLSKPR